MTEKLTNLGDADLLYVVDAQYGSRKMTGEQLKKSLGSEVSITQDPQNAEHVIITIGTISQ